jgi:hypothetical protein
MRHIVLAAIAIVGQAACAATDDDRTTSPIVTMTDGEAASTSPTTSHHTGPTTNPTGDEPAASSDPAVSAVSTHEPSDHRAPVATTAPGSVPPTSADRDEGVIVRFSSPTIEVGVTVAGDNPTIRDFLSLLPLTIRFEEFNGREKISYLPRPLDTSASAGHDSEDGDLIYYAPWGNLGFYYNADGIGHDENVIHIGTYNATPADLAGLETGDVTVTVIDGP